MKKFFAIFLLCVHLFYIGGYTLLFEYYIHKADTQMVKEVFSNKIDNNKLILLKIPVHLPTQENQSEFEDVAGQIQLKDAYYNYIRLKITRDTAYFVCLPNTAKTRLVNANIYTAKEISDVPLSKSSHAPMVKKVNMLSEYKLEAFQYNYAAIGAYVKYNAFVKPTIINDPFIESPGKPPNQLV